MRVICRYFNDVQIVLGGMGVMIVACMMFVLNPSGRSGLPLFLWAVFLMYSVGYPIGHTAVSAWTTTAVLPDVLARCVECGVTCFFFFFAGVFYAYCGDILLVWPSVRVCRASALAGGVFESSPRRTGNNWKAGLRGSVLRKC